jgi:hypothetical protein
VLRGFASVAVALLCLGTFPAESLSQSTSLDEMRNGFIEGRARLQSCTFEAQVDLEHTVAGKSQSEQRKLTGTIDFTTDSWRQLEVLPEKREKLYNHLPKSLCHRIWVKLDGKESYWVPPNILTCDFEDAPTEARVRVLDPRVIGLIPSVEFWKGKGEKDYVKLTETWLQERNWKLVSTTVENSLVTMRCTHQTDLDLQRTLIVDTNKDFVPTFLEVAVIGETGKKMALLTSSTEWTAIKGVWVPTGSISERRNLDGSNTEECSVEIQWSSVNDVVDANRFKIEEDILPIGTVVSSMSTGKPLVIKQIGVDVPTAAMLRDEPMAPGESRSLLSLLLNPLIAGNLIVLGLIVGILGWRRFRSDKR